MDTMKGLFHGVAIDPPAHRPHKLTSPSPAMYKQEAQQGTGRPLLQPSTRGAAIMIQPIRTILLLFLIAFLPLGCSHIGEAAGKAKAGIENAINDTRSGYNKGYSEEKGQKSSSSRTSSKDSVAHL